MNQIACTVICLDPELHLLTQSALALLQSTGVQEAISFEFGGCSNILPEAGSDAIRSWRDLEFLLAAEKSRRRCDRLIAVLNHPIEKNWFSRTAYGKDIAWITTYNWEFYSDVPAACFVAHQLISNLILTLTIKTPEEESWLLNEVLHVKETRGCISDMCLHKPDISVGIRSGKVCNDCTRILENRLGVKVVAALLELLEAVRQAASSNEADVRLNIDDFPFIEELSRSAHWAKEDYRAELEEQRFETSKRLEQLELEKRTLRQKLADTEKQLKALPTVCNAHIQLTAASPSVPYSPRRQRSPLQLAHGQVAQIGLYQEIERRYPFPIAYCFRSMRSLVSYTEKWMTLYVLYKLVVRYVTFVLLADSHQRNVAMPGDLKRLLSQLSYGSDGTWGKACFRLLENLSQNGAAQSSVARFLTSIEPNHLAELAAVSKSLVQDRNDNTGHGYQVDVAVYQRLFESSIEGVKKFLRFLAPLTDYPLIMPFQVERNYGGNCVHHTKILMGAHPLFEVVQMADEQMPPTVCQVLLPRGGRLLLHPWLHVERCSKCQREMVFLYDTLSGSGPNQTAVLREYPSNHKKNRGDLLIEICELLGTPSP